jgi:hypothetical protein
MINLLLMPLIGRMQIQLFKLYIGFYVIVVGIYNESTRREQHGNTLNTECEDSIIN